MLTNPCFCVFGDAFRVLHFYCTPWCASPHPPHPPPFPLLFQGLEPPTKFLKRGEGGGSRGLQLSEGGNFFQGGFNFTKKKFKMKYKIFDDKKSL